MLLWSFRFEEGDVVVHLLSQHGEHMGRRVAHLVGDGKCEYEASLIL